jgi:Fur family zinc uptake transcriptional regulator
MADPRSGSPRPSPHTKATVERYLDVARRRCERLGVQWTPLRAEMLRLLLARGGSAKAYELLADMQAAHGKTAPMTVYRALDFLVERGLVHRVASSSTFVACHHPDAPHADAMFLVCDLCGSAVECDDAALAGSLVQTLRTAGFDARNVEIRGRCEHCREAPPPA